MANMAIWLYSYMAYDEYIKYMVLTINIKIPKIFNHITI